MNSELRTVNSQWRTGLSCRLDGLTPDLREHQRIAAIKSLGLLELENLPIFNEATQIGARFLETPICMLGLMVETELLLKGTVGLSRMGLMNQIATSRKIPKADAFCTYVVDSEQPLVVEDTYQQSVFVSSSLTQYYGVRAYLGVPLFTLGGQCIGTMAVMDLVPHQFSLKDLEFLAITARWCLREFEQIYLGKLPVNLSSVPLMLSDTQEIDENRTFSEQTKISFSSDQGVAGIADIKQQLLSQLIPELKTPLTAVIGMASMLKQKVYGSLNAKQIEYLDIIYHSGQNLAALVEELVSLQIVDEDVNELKLNPVDLEMLGQQVINSVVQIAKEHHQELKLSVEPGDRVWLLDKDKVRQALYYLIMHIINYTEEGSEVKLHIAHRHKSIDLIIWASHPWLDRGITTMPIYHELMSDPNIISEEDDQSWELGAYGVQRKILNSWDVLSQLNEGLIDQTKSSQKIIRETLGLLLSCLLIEIHGGTIIIQDSSELNYRYIVKLPKLAIR